MTGQEDFAGPLTPQGSRPGDPARPHTPAARTAWEVAELARVLVTVGNRGIVPVRRRPDIRAG